MKNQIKTKIIEHPLIRISTKEIIWTISLVLIAIITPAILAHTPQNQWITGTLVNATLFLAASQLPFGNTLLIAVIPSTIALSRGLLALPMAMLIPYIIISNLLLIIAFKWLNKKPLIGVLFSSLIKFSFLYFLTLVLANSFDLNTKVLTMFSYPQLITALAGGFLALGVIKFFKKKKGA